MVWSADRTDDVLATYRDLTESAPRELTMAVNLRLAPPAPFLPDAWHGKPIIGVLLCHSGENAGADLAPLRALGKPIADLVTEKPYTDQQSMLDGTEPKGRHYYWKTEYLAGLSSEFLDTFRDSALKVTSPLSESLVIHLAGALNDLADDDGAVGNRDARYLSAFAGQWPADTGDDEHVAWVREAWKSVRPFSTGATTSTSRPPTKTRSVSGRPTATTSTASSTSRRNTTRRTCSARTGTSVLEPEHARQGRHSCLACPDRRCRYCRSRPRPRPASAGHHR